jgi:hypothetical protein
MTPEITNKTFRIYDRSRKPVEDAGKDSQRAQPILQISTTGQFAAG